MSDTTTIIVAEDQELVRNYIADVLKEAGYTVRTVSNGDEALTILRTEPVHLILSDIAMPNMNGYQLYEAVRANPDWINIPVIFLTARELDSDIRFGKSLGVDDYITKPVHPADLRAAVKGKLRRAQQIEQYLSLRANHVEAKEPVLSDTVMIVGKLRMDTNQHRVWHEDTPIDLSAREFALLQYLMEHAKTVVSHEELVTVTHGITTDRNDAASLLRPLIRTLRRKLGYNVGNSGCIENIRSVGYRLITPKD